MVDRAVHGESVGFMMSPVADSTLSISCLWAGRTPGPVHLIQVEIGIPRCIKCRSISAEKSAFNLARCSNRLEWSHSVRPLELSRQRAARQSEGQPEDALWAAFEQWVHVPAVVIDPRDRAWWWEQVYSAMERHRLTELSRAREEGQPP